MTGVAPSISGVHSNGIQVKNRGNLLNFRSRRWGLEHASSSNRTE